VAVVGPASQQLPAGNLGVAAAQDRCHPVKTCGCHRCPFGRCRLRR
jgi:hypothetical protein